MTHQTATVVVELRTRRNATIAPGADGLVRPEPDKKRASYIGLLHQRSKIRWKDMKRVKVGGGTVRAMTENEIDDWYARVQAIKAGRDRDYHVVRKPPLPEDAFERNQRAEAHAAEIRQQPSRRSEVV
jgi:hypothetical protein